MRAALRPLVLLFVAFLILPRPAAGETSFEAPPTDAAIAAPDRQEGFFTIHFDEEDGRLLLEVDRLEKDFLYMTGLATGSGMSSPLLDRGQIQGEFIGRFLRRGNKLYLELQNPRFTSYDADNPALLQSVEESFAKSVIASFEIVESNDEGYLIDATDFFSGDALNLQRRMQQAGHGNFSHNRERSYIHSARAFPKNTEIQSAVTFVANDPSGQVQGHVPDGRYLTHRVHHSLVELPDDGYEPRPFDPRVGYFSVQRYDFSRGLDEDYVQRHIVRHRLQKTDPEAEVSEVVEPIVYYVDPGIPEPYREAFFEGFEWFAGLFEDAGFRDAFEVRDMPEDMDPMDARYNTVVWVHRSEPGPSVGPTFRDPRTGEIIKATVRMDSHRSHVNFDMFRAYLPALVEGADAEEVAMARRRQHAAHEIGHTLGLAHNFIAESYGRASVMDYPAPKLRLTDEGRIDVSEAYSPGPGVYDSLAIRWGYGQFPEDQEEARLQEIIDEIVDRDIEFITHPWHGASGSHPRASTWALNEDPLTEFDQALSIRQVLMEHFDESVLLEGEPLWRLNERFNHVYFHHRFSLEALAKYPGGYEFQYSIKGDGRGAGEVIDAADQRRALTLLMDAIEPEHLIIPEHVERNMAPRPYGFADNDRTINTSGGPAFDQLGPAHALTGMVFDHLLHPQRVARIVAFADRNAENPTMEEVVDYLIERVWRRDNADEHTAYHIIAQRALLMALMELAENDNAVYEGQAAAEYGLSGIQRIIEDAAPDDARLTSHLNRAERQLARFFRDGTIPERPGAVPPPPAGTPIGSE